MDPQLKQRLVGAAVLIALAVLIIPAFLEQDSPAPAPLVKRDMAPMPVDDLPATLTPVDPDVIEEISSGMTATSAELGARLPPSDPLPVPPVAATAPAESGALSTPHAEPAVTDTPVPAASLPPARAGDWVIQLGSFTSQDNATTLQERVRKAGFGAYIAPLATSGKPSYRVRVGGSTNRQEAERVHARLSRELGFSGMVVKAE